MRDAVASGAGPARDGQEARCLQPSVIQDTLAGVSQDAAPLPYWFNTSPRGTQVRRRQQNLSSKCDLPLLDEASTCTFQEAAEKVKSQNCTSHSVAECGHAGACDRYRASHNSKSLNTTQTGLLK